MDRMESASAPSEAGLYWVRTYPKGPEGAGYDALVEIRGLAPFLSKRLVWSNQGFELLGQVCIYEWGPRAEPPKVGEG